VRIRFRDPGPRGRGRGPERVGPGVESVHARDHVCSSYIPLVRKCGYCIGGQRLLRAADKARCSSRRHHAFRKNDEPHPLNLASPSTRRTPPHGGEASSRSARTRRSKWCVSSPRRAVGAGRYSTRLEGAARASAPGGAGGVGLNTIHCGAAGRRGQDPSAVDVMPHKQLRLGRGLRATHFFNRRRRSRRALLRSAHRW